MESRAALLASMPDAEKSVKNLDMDSEDVFEHYQVAVASSGQKKDDKRARGESSKTASKKGLLTITAGWHRAGALVSQGRNFDTRLAKAKQALEDKNNELAKHNDELLGEKVALPKQKDELLEDKANLTKELLETQDALKKANESREKFRESAKLNYQQAVQLELDLIASRQEAEELSKRVQQLKEAGAKNLERYKEATHLCFYEFWKHNREANFSYLSERLRTTLMAQCAIRLEEEGKAEVPASPEISLTLAISAQLNYKLNNEVHLSMSYTQESKDLQLNISDELKATKAKMEAEVE
ncbi:uncharacterized protein LOC133795681 [Humulus lupulus]|uniref:uncharacterized protein LOC133795681 n=1 Tax=Humulus lupulus TaxID=3486 RepID=UPI002B405227|nr:uncharacterized protein LOC133795681 [Humulus lupulus]